MQTQQLQQRPTQQQQPMDKDTYIRLMKSLRYHIKRGNISQNDAINIVMYTFECSYLSTKGRLGIYKAKSDNNSAVSTEHNTSKTQDIVGDAATMSIEASEEADADIEVNV
jgi:hypothetical protein